MSIKVPKPVLTAVEGSGTVLDVAVTEMLVRYK